MGETTVPILPCRTLQPVLDFYTPLGFEVTFLQRRPNPYAVVQRGGIHLHFFGMKDYEPTASYSTCCIRTDDVDALHAAFRTGLRAAYGRVPVRGLPRIGPLKDTSYGARQFLMTDPGGNCLRIAQPKDDAPRHRPAPRGTFPRALHHAALLADSKEDLPGAARIIDRALGIRDEQPAPTELLRLLVLRADLAQRSGDTETSRRVQAEAEKAAGRLTAGEREAVRDDLRRLATLRDGM
ncbi:VOC family protein [Streptomyces sp. WMMB303]|uniref:bleomycin resistance protein n=1 Tax=Streptomyces sp. WMMB303 TaxID=3034154 RepID=UPI0023EA9B2C|nr:VOC family protein [Streptomyces sp. WMMB303]MDF4250319.1 VOC family protein [Streptomyces sp. WMMB303]